MLPNGVFEMPFYIKTSNICVIRTVSYVSAKACVIVLPWGWGFRALSHMIFAPGALVMQPILPLGSGVSPSQKLPRESARGMLTAGIN